MNRKSIVLVGGPDSGKSNYVGRLWGALKAGKGTLKRAGLPKNIQYVESICAHLLRGEFAGRTDRNLQRQDFCVPLKADNSSELSELVVPDFTGELWLNAVKDSELSQEWLDALEQARGALLFVRVHSPQNVQPLDWVTARDVLKLPAEHSSDEFALPTQVMLCELLRLLQDRLARGADGDIPRVAVVVTAWDCLDEEQRAAGPLAFLKRQFPLFAGAIEDCDDTAIQVYGVTIVGGDLQRDPAFKKKYEHMVMAESGHVVLERNGSWESDRDVTLPVAWVIGESVK